MWLCTLFRSHSWFIRYIYTWLYMYTVSIYAQTLCGYPWVSQRINTYGLICIQPLASYVLAYWLNTTHVNILILQINNSFHPTSSCFSAEYCRVFAMNHSSVQGKYQSLPGFRWVWGSTPTTSKMSSCCAHAQPRILSGSDKRSRICWASSKILTVIPTTGYSGVTHYEK